MQERPSLPPEHGVGLPPRADATASGATAGQPLPSILEGVQGLGKRVTYCETKIQLGELIQKVALGTGERGLQASRAFAHGL